MSEPDLTRLTDDAAMFYDQEGQATLVWGLFCTPPNLGVAWQCNPC